MTLLTRDPRCTQYSPTPAAEYTVSVTGILCRNMHSGAHVSLGGLYAMERIFDFSLDSITAKIKLRHM